MKLNLIKLHKAREKRSSRTERTIHEYSTNPCIVAKSLPATTHSKCKWPRWRQCNQNGLVTPGALLPVHNHVQSVAAKFPQAARCAPVMRRGRGVPDLKCPVNGWSWSAGQGVLTSANWGKVQTQKPHRYDTKHSGCLLKLRNSTLYINSLLYNTQHAQRGRTRDT